MNKNLLPTARTKNLVAQELPNEILFYDLDASRAVCLNQTAKLIFEQCDGKTTFEEALQNIEKKTGEKLSLEIICKGLHQLKSSRLLNETDFAIPKVSRRAMMRSGLALSISLPLITFVAAPTPLQAQSLPPTCFAPGDFSVSSANPLFDCQNSVQLCCSGSITTDFCQAAAPPNAIFCVCICN